MYVLSFVSITNVAKETNRMTEVSQAVLTVGKEKSKKSKFVRRFIRISQTSTVIYIFLRI